MGERKDTYGDRKDPYGGPKEPYGGVQKEQYSISEFLTKMAQGEQVNTFKIRFSTRKMHHHLFRLMWEVSHEGRCRRETLLKEDGSLGEGGQSQ